MTSSLVARPSRAPQRFDRARIAPAADALEGPEYG